MWVLFCFLSSQLSSSTKHHAEKHPLLLSIYTGKKPSQHTSRETEAKPHGPQCHQCPMQGAGTRVLDSPSAGTGPSLIPIVQDGHMRQHISSKQRKRMAARDNVGASRCCKSPKQPHGAAVAELLRSRRVKPHAVTQSNNNNIPKADKLRLNHSSPSFLDDPIFLFILPIPNTHLLRLSPRCTEEFEINHDEWPDFLVSGTVLFFLRHI